MVAMLASDTTTYAGFFAAAFKRGQMLFGCGGVRGKVTVRLSVEFVARLLAVLRRVDIERLLEALVRLVVI